MPRLGENDSTNAKVYDPTDKKSSFENMIFDPPPKEFVFGHTDAVQCCAYSHDGCFIASGGADGILCIWKTSSAECIRNLNHYDKWIFDVTWHGPDDELLVTGSGDKVIRVWQVKPPGQKPIQDLLEEPHVIRVLKSHENWVLTVKYFTHRGNEFLISGSADKTIRTWDVVKGEPLSIGRRHQSWINSIDVARIPDLETNEMKTIVACGSSDNRVSLWEVTTRRDGVEGKLVCIKTLLQHKDWVTSVVFTHDGKRILSASKDCTICIWDSRHQNLLAVMDDGHQEPIYAVMQSDLNKQGIRHVISTSSDKLCMFWNLEGAGVLRKASKRIKQAIGHSAPIYDLSFSPDGNFFCTASEDTTVRIWNAVTCVCLLKCEHREDTSWQDKL